MYTNHLVKAVLTQLLFIYIAVECVSDRPNIVFIVADDLVSWINFV